VRVYALYVRAYGVPVACTHMFVCMRYSCAHLFLFVCIACCACGTVCPRIACSCACGIHVLICFFLYALVYCVCGTVCPHIACSCACGVARAHLFLFCMHLCTLCMFYHLINITKGKIRRPRILFWWNNNGS